MDEIIKEFLVETYESLDQIDNDLVTFEREPTNEEVLGNIFRIIHSIKGTSGFLGLSKLESVTHLGENLLTHLRDGTRLPTLERTTALLELMDAVREMLSHVEEHENEGDTDYAELKETLKRLQEEDTPAPAADEAPAAEEADSGEPAAEDMPAETEDDPAVSVEDIAAEAEALANESREPAEEAALASESPEASAPSPSVETVAGPAAANGSKTEATKGSSLAADNIRVNIAQLNKLMNLVGELVLARNQILQFAEGNPDRGLVTTVQRLNLITTELQEGVMKTRMQPIGNIWNKFPRIIRDLAIACEKKVRLEMEGEDTELDNTIIEAIKDPLTHIVRNCADHGVERPEVREAAGKPAEGVVLMQAYHEGGQVIIEISDDGAGVNIERVKQKAIEKNLITHEQAEKMSDREVVNLVMLPGFSTADKITNVSGRGVGMDVVKTNIEKIGGLIDLNSVPGKGTTLKIKIPLTLAIIPALIISSGGENFAIPQVSLLELVRFEGDDIEKNIEWIRDTPVYRLRGQLLPIVFLNRTLGLDDVKATGEGAEENTEEGAPAEKEPMCIVVLQAGERQFGLVVDEINDTEEIVVKPLGKQLKGITAYAGTTIMGDGKVALILDIIGLAQRAKVVSELQERVHPDSKKSGQSGSSKTENFLLIGFGKERRMAIPLSAISRLEELPRSSIEAAGDQEVIQYRGVILPLIHVSRVFGGWERSFDEAAESDESLMRVIVYSDGDTNVGLVVDEILDVTEETLKIDRSSRRRGILGSAVIQDHVTDILDIREIIEDSGIEISKALETTEATV